MVFGLIEKVNRGNHYMRIIYKQFKYDTAARVLGCTVDELLKEE